VLQTLVDVISLTKPRLATLVIFTTGAGMLLAPTPVALPQAILAIALTTMIVGAGTSLNMALEVEPDGRMERTRDRALPAGRLRPKVAWILGLISGAIGVPLMAILVNPVTAGLGLMALVLYVAVYTPLKKRSVASVYVGAIPGATPIMMGWTAATGRLDLPAIALFAILFLWQIPHFIAISMYRREEYAAAGFRILPLEYGDRASLWHMLGTSIGLGVATVLPMRFDLGGTWYAITAIALATVALGGTLYGLTPHAGDGWARRYFLTTLIYLPVLLGVLVLDT